MKIAFNECTSYQPFMEHEVRPFKAVDQTNTMVLSVAQEKIVSFATLIPRFDFVILNGFNDVMEYKAFFVLVYTKVIEELVLVSCIRILIFTHFKTQGHSVKHSPTKGEWCRKGKQRFILPLSYFLLAINCIFILGHSF